MTVWHGEPEQPHMFPMEAGDVCLLDNFVWHQVMCALQSYQTNQLLLQGNPITSGERWALVIFYSVRKVASCALCFRRTHGCCDTRRKVLA